MYINDNKVNNRNASFVFLLYSHFKIRLDRNIDKTTFVHIEYLNIMVYYIEVNIFL